jgi:hypothetical protein
MCFWPGEKYALLGRRRTCTSSKTNVHLEENIHTPPIHTPPIHTPPIHTPPIHAPPIHSSHTTIRTCKCTTIADCSLPLLSATALCHCLCHMYIRWIPSIPPGPAQPGEEPRLHRAGPCGSVCRQPPSPPQDVGWGREKIGRT